ncbi:MAG TPA: TIGR00300 family protein, partial [Spirochaetia bacterium]|nr:TIGR00300 family protein [Spirochaetia bacterium]
MTKRFVSDGHLIDSGILPNILNIIIEEGAEYHISDFRIGKTNLETTHIEFDLVCQDEEQLSDLTKKLLRIGCYEKSVTESQFKEAPKDGAAPDDFYSTTNHRTEIFFEGRWRQVADQRMDGVIVVAPSGPAVRLLREIRKGDLILCSTQSVRVFPTERDRQTDIFGFMNGDVSSERSVDIAVAQIAEDWIEVKKRGGKVIVVAGPVVVHTGGAAALGALIREGFVQGLL